MRNWYFEIWNEPNALNTSAYIDSDTYFEMLKSAYLIIKNYTNIDVVLAKHYLSPYLAGQYSALSVTGKIIAYGSGAFITVMFPMVAASHINNDGKEKNTDSKDNS